MPYRFIVNDTVWDYLNGINNPMTEFEKQQLDKECLNIIEAKYGKDMIETITKSKNEYTNK